MAKLAHSSEGKVMGKLKVADLETLSPKTHHDGDGLYFDKKKRGASWTYKFTLNGRAREISESEREEANRRRRRKRRGKEWQRTKCQTENKFDRNIERQ